MGRRIAVLVATMLRAVPLIMLVAGVVRVQSAAEDPGNTEGMEKAYIVLYKQEAVPAGSAGQMRAAGGLDRGDVRVDRCGPRALGQRLVRLVRLVRLDARAGRPPRRGCVRVGARLQGRPGRRVEPRRAGAGAARTRRPPMPTRSRRSSGTCARSSALRRTGSPAVAPRSSRRRSTRASTSRTLTSRQTTTRRIARTARAAPQHPSRPATTSTATARTRPGRWPLTTTASGPSASRRT